MKPRHARKKSKKAFNGVALNDAPLERALRIMPPRQEFPVMPTVGDPRLGKTRMLQEYSRDYRNWEIAQGEKVAEECRNGTTRTITRMKPLRFKHGFLSASMSF